MTWELSFCILFFQTRPPILSYSTLIKRNVNFLYKFSCIFFIVIQRKAILFLLKIESSRKS